MSLGHPSLRWLVFTVDWGWNYKTAHMQAKINSQEGYGNRKALGATYRIESRYQKQKKKNEKKKKMIIVLL